MSEWAQIHNKITGHIEQSITIFTGWISFFKKNDGAYRIFLFIFILPLLGSLLLNESE